MSKCLIKCLGHKFVLNITQVAVDTQLTVQRECLIKMGIWYKVCVLVKEDIKHDSAFASVLLFLQKPVELH